jgi:hypothetical protein
MPTSVTIKSPDARPAAKRNTTPTIASTLINTKYR